MLKLLSINIFLYFVQILFSEVHFLVKNGYIFKQNICTMLNPIINMLREKKCYIIQNEVEIKQKIST